MRLTNRFDLPQALVNFATRDPYDRGAAAISVTELIDSPRVVELRHAHANDMEEDVADKLWALVGRALHTVAEASSDDENHIVEERIFLKMSNGWTISGAIDVQELVGPAWTDRGGTVRPSKDLVDLYDYKFTSCYNVMNDKPAWEQQLNIYGHLVKVSKQREVRNLFIIGILRDWRRSDAEKNPDYPQAPIIKLPVRQWSDNEMTDYLQGRVALHEAARDLTFDEIEDCSYEERWQNESSWAVMKNDGIKAIRVFDSDAAAQADAVERNAKAKKGDVYVVNHRPGTRMRCEGNYCGVADQCNVWQAIKRTRN